MPRIVPADSEHIRLAAEALRRGGVVAFPTETVYGLGADTFNAAAVECVYTLKGRPQDNPLIAHVLDAAAAQLLVFDWPEHAAQLTSLFWPGPLTLVLRRSPSVPPQATGGRDTIAVRAPAHPTARALLQQFGGPISAPSANRSGGVSATLASHIAEDFAEIDDLIIIDGGPSELGIESTVLDLTTDPPRVLRPGMIDADQLHAALDTVESARLDAQDASPGTSPRHYSPQHPMRLCDHDEIEVMLCARATDDVRVPNATVMILMRSTANRFFGEQLPHHVIAMPEDADHYAAALYAALRSADQLKIDGIIVERPESTDGLWASIHDRLRRAAG